MLVTTLLAGELEDVAFEPEEFVLRFPLMKTTKTAAYAAVEAKTSCRRALVKSAREIANPTVRPLNMPSLAFGLRTQYNPRTAPSRNKMASIPLMTDTAIETRLCDTKSERPSAVLVYGP